MGPWFGLVPELDARIKDMDRAADSLGSSDDNTTPGERQERQEKFNLAYSTVVWHCLKPSFASLGVFFIDTMIGIPLLWKHVSVLPALVIALAIVSKQRPATTLIILSMISTAPWTSRSFTRILGVYLCFDTFFSPLLWYIYEEISDHTEIRWIMIGCVLNTVYLGTVALTYMFRPIFAVLVAFISWMGITFFGIFVHDPGWIKILAEAAPEMQVPGKPLESIFRHALQVFIFRLNGIIRYWAKRSRARVGSAPTPRWWVIPYTYHSLHNDITEHKRDIRLLRILKGTAHEEIACQLIVVSLDTPGTFDAISYVRGNPLKEKKIVVDGCDLSITQSAYDIIYRRRSPGVDRLIWIDQVCIKQEAGDDSLEKDYQVQLMKGIYEAATRVLAFLRLDHSMVEIGKPTPRPNAYLVQSHFAELFYRHEILGHNPASFNAVYQSESKAAQWDALVAFFANPWFRRVWIVQEAVFAKDLIIFYGDICLDWRHLARAVNVIYEQNLLQRFQSEDLYPYSTLQNEYKMGLHNVDSMLEFRGDAKSHLARTLAQDPYHFTQEPFLEAFIRTVLGNRTSYGTDPRPTTEQCLRDYEAFYKIDELKERLQALVENGDPSAIV
ncbi:hypothetical protein VTL71DRAFT_2901 [Oculimacula yallundae]|uniref:Heterokaryon incompatibility domain-containing protein n=1 Tax=Oculimacula yallundae TaxID=86028 RepID=A0ABR4C6F7_9HELO